MRARAPTELDRALATKPTTRHQLHHARYIGKRIASEHCTFVGDRTSPRALAQLGYDDEGVKDPDSPSSIKASSATQTTRDRRTSSADKNRTAAASRLLGHRPLPALPNVYLKPALPTPLETSSQA